MTTRRANRRVIATTAVASIVAGLMLAAFGVASAPAGAAPPEKVVICHATKAKTNPYQENEVSSNAIDGDHGHGSDIGPVFDYAHPAANTRWGDIIPPFEGFAGLNWDADGQTIHGAHCAPVEIDLCELDPELTADDPACGAPVVPEVCEFDPELSADDPACGAPVVPEVCEFVPELSADDPACGAPVVPEVCEFVPELSADDPACGAPVVPEVCEFDPELSADDPACGAPVVPEVCEFDPELTADDPACTPQVGNQSVTPPTAAPPGDPGPALPSEGGSAQDETVAPATIAGGTLPRTGGAHGPLVTAALILILLGVCTLTAQRVARPSRRGTHFAA